MKIDIVPFEEKHITVKYLNWMRDNIISLYIESANSGYTMKQLEDYCNRMINNVDEHFFAILCNNEHIGNFRIGTVKNNKTKFGILIGEQCLWNNGIGKKVIRWGIKHAFNKLNLNEIWVDVDYFNEGAIGLYESCGFCFKKVDGNKLIFKKIKG